VPARDVAAVCGAVSSTTTTPGAAQARHSGQLTRGLFQQRGQPSDGGSSAIGGSVSGGAPSRAGSTAWRLCHMRRWPNCEVRGLRISGLVRTRAPVTPRGNVPDLSTSAAGCEGVMAYAEELAPWLHAVSPARAVSCNPRIRRR